MAGSKIPMGEVEVEIGALILGDYRYAGSKLGGLWEIRESSQRTSR